jgi:hypothetical protein
VTFCIAIPPHSRINWSAWDFFSKLPPRTRKTNDFRKAAPFLKEFGCEINDSFDSQDIAAMLPNNIKEREFDIAEYPIDTDSGLAHQIRRHSYLTMGPGRRFGRD